VSVTTGTTSTVTLDPWLDCEPHLHARLLEPLLEFYKLELGEDALVELVTDLGTSLQVLQDPDRWFSVDLFQMLIDAMVRSTGDADISYRAGRAMAWASMMGPEKMLVRGFANPTVAYANINRVTGRLSKITGWEVQVHRRGRATATAIIADGVADSIEFCRNRTGVLEAIPEGFALPAARVHHPACSHRGDDACVYELHWVERNPWLQRGWIAVVLLFVATGVTSLVAPAGFAPLAVISAFAALSIGVASAFSYRQVERDTQEMTHRTVDKLQALLERNDRRILELQAIQTITAAAVQKRDEAELVDTVLDELRRKLGYDRSLLLRVDESGERLGKARSSGFGEQRGLLAALDVSVEPAGEHPALFGHILGENQTVLVQADEAYLESLLPPNAELLRAIGSRSFVASPVVAPGSSAPLALLVVDRTGDEPLNLYDRDLVGSVASMLGTAMSNVRQLRQIQRELLINQKFQQYLPAKAAEEILADPTARLRLGGQRRELAIMFTDMAGFTKASAEMTPEEVVAGLNEWFKTTDPCIRSCNGIVDKRMGDGILVVFLPEDGDRFGRHPVERAAASAVQMLSSLDERRGQIAAVAPGFADMEVRYAIHYGSAIVGNMGSAERMEYTVIGDAVNTCSRVESITPPGCIWLTGEAVRAVGPEGLAGATLEKKVVLRGRESETEVWSLDPEAEATMSGTFVGMAPVEELDGATTTLSPEPEEV